MNDMEKYEDILYLPRPLSRKHAPMPRADRAAQFSPFAALTGYEAAVREEARLTDERIELDENAVAELNEKLMLLTACPEQTPGVQITYFLPDRQKSGGAYVCITGTVKTIDEENRAVILTDDTKIPIEQIYELEYRPVPEMQ